MKVVKMNNGNVKLEADENKVIVSKSKHYDEELKKEIEDIKGKIIYLGKNDTKDNYEEITEETK